MSALSDLTMLLITRNRPRLLRDSLEAYAAWPHRPNVTVLDSSDPAIQSQNRDAARTYGFEFVAYPPDMYAAEKVRRGSTLPQTPLVVFASDDDPFVPEGIQAAATFLREHADYVACHGIYYGASVPEPGKLRLVVEQTNLSIDSDTAYVRAFSLLARYRSVFYSVARRDEFAATLQRLDVVASSHFNELLQACNLVVMGKMAALSVPYLIRNQQAGTVPFYIAHPTGMLVHDPAEYAADYLRFRSEVAAALANAEPGRDWGPLVDLAYAVYAAKNFSYATVFDYLAQKQGMPAGELSALYKAMDFPNQAPIPTERLTRILSGYIARGWPHYG